MIPKKKHITKKQAINQVHYYNVVESYNALKEYYKTSKNQIVRIISKTNYTCNAKIIDSPNKSEIGLVKMFIVNELIQIEISENLIKK